MHAISINKNADHPEARASSRLEGSEKVGRNVLVVLILQIERESSWSLVPYASLGLAHSYGSLLRNSGGLM